MAGIHFDIVHELERMGFKVHASYIHEPEENSRDGMRMSISKDKGKIQQVAHEWSKLEVLTAKDIAEAIVSSMRMEEALN